MKTKLQFLFFFLLILAFSSCDHSVSMETTVHADGTLDKVMVFENKDSAKNILGITEKNGWKKSIQQKSGQSDSTRNKEIIIILKKTFSSAEEANAELALQNDTLFQVTSSFEKKFRWFYTYVYYADTYHSLNRMKLAADTYFTQEDYAFIDRLPAEGEPISKADSLFLSRLNEKAFDIYGMRALYEEYYNVYNELIEKSHLEKRWIDTLRSHKEDIFNLLVRGKDADDNFFLHVMDSLHFPLPYNDLLKQPKKLTKELDSKTSFISTANDGKYQHRINMPWSIVSTNADSLSGSSAMWKPSSIKFLLKDYTMYAEARSLNYWAIIISALIIGLTVYVFFRKKE